MVVVTLNARSDSRVPRVPDRARGRAADEGGRQEPARTSRCDHDPAGLPARAASVRAVLPPLGAGRHRPWPAARFSAQERDTLGPPADGDRTPRLASPSARARARPLPVLERAGRTHECRRLPQNDYEARQSLGLGTSVSVQAAPRHEPAPKSGQLASRRDLCRARAGEDLFVDCIAPIMRGTPQARRAGRALPQTNLQLVADCKAQNPNFASVMRRHRKQSSRQCRRAHPSRPRPRQSRPRRRPITVVSAKSEFGEHPETCLNPPNATGRRPTDQRCCLPPVRVAIGTRSQGAFRVK